MPGRIPLFLAVANPRRREPGGSRSPARTELHVCDACAFTRSAVPAIPCGFFRLLIRKSLPAGCGASVVLSQYAARVCAINDVDSHHSESGGLSFGWAVDGLV